MLYCSHMNTTQQSYITHPEKFKQIMWDYNLSPQEFFAILNKEHQKGWFTQDWAITRILEHAPYYDAIALVPLPTLRQRWEHIKPKLFNRSLQQGYEYVLHKYALSTAR